MEFYQKLKIARHKAQLKQWQVCRLLGIPARTYERWETGGRVPPSHVQRMLLYVLDVTRAEILAGELRADLIQEIIAPDDMLFVLRDERGLICDWQMWPSDHEDLAHIDTTRYFQLSAEDTIRELERVIPYFKDEEVSFLFENLD